MTTILDDINVKICSMSFGESFVIWLQNEMDKRGWNQTDLAREANIARQTVSNIMNLYRTPGTDVCNAIAKALNIDPIMVFIKAGVLPEDEENNSILKEIEYKLKMIPEEKLGMILDLLDGMLANRRSSLSIAERKTKYHTGNQKD